MLISSDDQVKAYLKKIMSQLNKWMIGGKISKLVVVITSKDTGENVERWQFDVQIFNKGKEDKKSRAAKKAGDKENTAPEYVLAIILLGDEETLINTEAIGIQQPQRRQRRRKWRSSKRSNPFSDRSRPPSPSYLCWRAIVRSMCWCTLMRIARCPWSGAIVMRGRLRMERRCN